MSIKSDYHLHSHHSGDSDAPMEEMVKNGIAAGLEAMCFTEHVDFDFRPLGKEKSDMFELNADSYLYELLSLKKKYEDQIELLFGLECGMQPHTARENVRFIKEHEYDFVIASVHLCGGKDPYYPEYFEGKEEEEALREYLEETLGDSVSVDGITAPLIQADLTFDQLMAGSIAARFGLKMQ